MLTFNTPESNGLTASLEAMAPLYDQYFRKYGILRPVQLVQPKAQKLEELVLPQNSLLHYIPEDEIEVCIPQTHPLLAQTERLTLIRHIDRLTSEEGKPRLLPVPVASIKTQFHRRNRRTREMITPEVTLREMDTDEKKVGGGPVGTAPLQVKVYNYGLLNQLYRYPTNFFRAYNRWRNIQHTLWTHVGDVGRSHPNVNQFMFARLPTVLPPLAYLLRGEREMTRDLMSRFTQPESLFILEIWKWLGDKRSSSILSQATPAELRRVNIIFQEQDRWIMVNLGRLDDWRKRPDTEEGPPQLGGAVETKQIQRRFLRMLMALMEVRTGIIGDAPQPIAQTIDATPEVTIGEDSEVTVKTVVKPDPIQLKVTDEEGKTSKIRLTANLNLDKLPENLAEETEENRALIDEAISMDLKALDHLAAQYEESLVDGEEDSPVDTYEGDVSAMVKYVANETTPEKGVMDAVDQLADAGLLSGAEYRRMQALSSAYTRIDNPFGEGKLSDLLTVTPEELSLENPQQFPDNPQVPDKSLLKSTIVDYTPKYLKEIYPKDLARTLMCFQKAGIAVTGLDHEEVRNALNHFERFSLQLTPAQGRSSTIHLRLPKVKPDGTYIDNGSRYRMRIQRGDMPIRKINPRQVALSSYYDRCTISRSEKMVDNLHVWLTNRIVAMAMRADNDKVTEPALSNVFVSDNRTPRIYSMLAHRFLSFRSGDLFFYFDYGSRHEKFGAERVDIVEKGGLTVIGSKGENLLVVDNGNAIYEAVGLELKPLGNMQEILGITETPPTEVAEMKIFRKQVPVGIFLAYHLGVTELLRLLGVVPRRVPTGTRLNMADDEMAIRFQDETWVVPNEGGKAGLILAGLVKYEKITKDYSSHLFDRKDVYFNVLERAGMGVRYIREMTLLQQMFVDPITEDVLKEMGEPLDFIGLCFRSCELLTTDWSPQETDMAYMRLKGYERMVGAIYSEMIKSLRQFNSRGAIANRKIDMHPEAVWVNIATDSVKKAVEEANPVHCMREREEVTFSGHGGRSGRSMVERARVYHPNDMGVISESTKDSADVSVTTFTTANPTLTSVRGITRRIDIEKDGPASILSSPALLSPAADRDDGKRVGFIPIQHSSGTFTKGYTTTPLRTGFEHVIAHRVDDMFASSATAAGKIVALSNSVLTVEYENGEKQSVILGRRFGKAAGKNIPQMLVTDFKLGDVVKKGDILAYNSNYFAPDLLVPKQVVWKAGVMAMVAFMEHADTLEDSSVISEKLAEKLETATTTIRDITVKFTDVIHNLVQVGDEVEDDTILCTIEDAVTAESNLFSEKSLDMLQLLAANTPRAKQRGVVEKIEVLYHGDLEDMTESLSLVASKSDRASKRLCREMGEPPITGLVDATARIQSQPLIANHAVIRVYITGPVAAGVGDKVVFASQLKSVVGRLMSGRNETKDGTEIDAIFSYQSVANRIVRSPEIMGMANLLLLKLSKRMVNAYRN